MNNRIRTKVSSFLPIVLNFLQKQGYVKIISLFKTEAILLAGTKSILFVFKKLEEK